MTWRNLENETREHIEEKALDLIESGVPEREAWARARREFGNPTATIETSREQWGWVWLERIWQDLVYARRILFKDPGFALIAVISLALGVGANCAMFSFADVLLLRPLPVPNASGLLNVGSQSDRDAFEDMQVSYPDYLDFRDRNRSFAEVAAYDIRNASVTSGPDAPAERRSGVMVTANFFSAMQVQPALGRAFLPQENEVRGRDPVIILSHNYWKRQFAGDANTLGQPLRVNGIDFTIVGVLPEGFTGPDTFLQPDFYLPAMMWPAPAGGDPLLARDARTFDLRGRLKPGVSMEQAKAEGAAIGSALAAEYPTTNKGTTLRINTHLEQRLLESGPTAAVLAMLLLLAVSVLVVACANVAGLLASKVPARAREMSLRLAIGAGRGRVLRQLLTESAILAALGAVGGVAVGYAGIQLMSQLTIVADAPVALGFKLDYRVLSFGLLAAAGSVFLFGLGPALRSSRADLTESLRTSGSQPPHSRQWMRNALVCGQIALSMVLLTIASLMFQTFNRDLLAGPGFRGENVLTASFDPALAGYDDAKAAAFYKSLVERAGAAPGVRSVSLASMVPADYNYEAFPLVPEGYELPEGQQDVSVLVSRVDENYFNTVHVPLQRGRVFARTDSANAPLVAIVNETAASRYWPGQDPIGKQLQMRDGSSRTLTVVGVAKTGKYRFLMERPLEFVYVPYAQHPQRRMTVLLEAAGDPLGLALPLRQLVRELDANLPAFGVRSMQETFNKNAVEPNLLVVRLEAAMGGMGVLLALSGLYGLMAYSVSVRRREIGIRMAVGADKGDVLGLVMRQGLALAGAGSLIGIALSAGAGRLLVAAFPATENSVFTYLTVIPAVFAITMLAAWIPAGRAAKVDPAIVLRQG